MFKVNQQRKLLTSTLTLASILCLLATPLPLRAETEITRSTGGSLVANFSAMDPAGCVRTDALIQASENTTSVLGAPPPNTSSSVFVDLFQFNFCTNAFLFASGVSTTLGFAVDGGLKSGSVQGNMQVCGQSSLSVDFFCFPIAIDMTWMSISPIEVVNDVQHFHVGDTIITNHLNGMSRNATTSGTIVGDSVSWVQNAPQAAFIGSFQDNSIVVE